MTGSFRPEGGPIVWEGTIPLPPTALANLDSMNGRLPQGFWTLRIDDDAAQDVGVLRNWALILTYAPSTPPSVAVTITPLQVVPGADAIARAQVTPGTNPTGAQHSVYPTIPQSVPLDAPFVFRDDGVFPDTIASDLNFAAIMSIAQTAPPGAAPLNVLVIDDRGRNGQNIATFEVLNGTPGACCIDGACSVMLQSEECQNAGETLQGSDTTC